METGYQRLLDKLRELACVETIDHLLAWDQQVIMPAQGAAWRGRQRSYMAAARHRLLSSADLSECLASLSGAGELSADQRAVVDDAQWRVKRMASLPLELAERIAGLRVQSLHAWERARKEQDFSAVSSELREFIGCASERAHCIEPSSAPYQVLVEDYERGVRLEALQPMLAELRRELSLLLDELRELGAGSSELSFKEGDFPRAGQEVLCAQAVEAIGFSFAGGRLDTATHPFCQSCGTGDTRLTTRYHEDDLVSALTSSLHEAGHGLYEQGLPAEHAGSALGRSCGLGVHESQSMIWERQVGRSPEFLGFWYPIAQRLFPALERIDAQTFYRHMHRVQPGLIRIEADEITYHLHIAVRFELEQKLFAGELAVEDLPAAWDEAYRKTLGLSADNPRQGVLQDIHWYTGSYGYFPIYSVGAIYSAQLFSAFARQHPGWQQEFAAGRFRALLDWLTENIYRHGSRYRAVELIERATGEPPSARHLVEYLRKKYLTIFRRK